MGEEKHQESAVQRFHARVVAPSAAAENAGILSFVTAIGGGLVAVTRSTTTRARPGGGGTPVFRALVTGEESSRPLIESARRGHHGGRRPRSSRKETERRGGGARGGSLREVGCRWRVGDRCDRGKEKATQPVPRMSSRRRSVRRRRRDARTGSGTNVDGSRVFAEASAGRGHRWTRIGWSPRMRNRPTSFSEKERSSPRAACLSEGRKRDRGAARAGAVADSKARG
jgi:hypothetical protein